MRSAVGILVLAACGGGPTPAPQQPTLAADPAPAPVAAAPVARPTPADAIASSEFDVAIAVPAGTDKGTTIDQRMGYWGVDHIDLTHTDGRMLSVSAMVGRGGSALALARELRDQIATQDGNECGQPEPAEFLGRDGARFTCSLGDGKGTFYFSATARCNWSAMIGKRGPEEEYAPYVEAMLAKITIPSGAASPNVEACY
jgi:hypothetical protein